MHALVLAGLSILFSGIGIETLVAQHSSRKTATTTRSSIIAVADDAWSLWSVRGGVVAVRNFWSVSFALCVIKSQCMLKLNRERKHDVPDMVRFLPPSRSSSREVSAFCAGGIGGNDRGSRSPIRARRLPPWLGSDPFCTLTEGPGGAWSGWSLFQSRSRPSPFRAPSVMARGADGVEGGSVFAEAGPSGGRFSPSWKARKM